MNFGHVLAALALKMRDQLVFGYNLLDSFERYLKVFHLLRDLDGVQRDIAINKQLLKI